ncbi:hypothetical protein [Polyangium sorediatum]|uniref:Uncharacterized protein n=1 Tax=Polyangium sorediatum TaxID=889274 RepID=A0ABT6P881_9BACT|nr:hypothetical protein [Polyangium sorediatum]MDI1436370.1 hypothetical protein [Polyangium sorediatum]
MTFFRTGMGLFQLGRPRLPSRDEAAETLAQIAEKPGGARYLRGVLADDVPKTLVEAMPDDEVLVSLTERITTGRITFVLLRPRDIRAPGFFVEGDATGAVMGPENKAGDLRPAPEVPPEYPVLARVESDQVIESTAKLVADLAALLFGRFAREKRESTIARTYVLVAGEEGTRIQGARSTVDIALDTARWPGGGLGRPKPSVPVEYKSAAKSTGESARFAIDKLSASLGPASPPTSSRPAPAVPDAFVNVASGTAQTTKGAVDSLGKSFADLFRPTPFVRPRNASPVE